MVSLLILLGLCILMFFAGNSWLAITDPTECNYALTAKEMLAAGDWISPRIYGNYWYDKPIFFYWELLVAFRWLGINEFAARFFPALFATGGVLLTCFFGRKLYGKTVGFMAGVILATSLEYWYLSHAIITDMTLFVTVSAALVCFYLGYSRGDARLLYPAFAAAGIAVLTKGPIGLCLPGLIILIFLAWQRDLGYLLRKEIGWGFLLFLAIGSIWYVPMAWMHGTDFILGFLGVHNVLRATVSEHPILNVWYYYLLVFLAGFLPWGLVAVPGWLRQMFRQGWTPLDMGTRFLLVWAVTVFAVFQSFATKYVTYTLPYMMPIAILFARYFAERERIFRRIALGTVVLFCALFCLVAVPICRDSSGKAVAEALSSVASKDACIVSFSRTYSASVVFYSGREVFRLEGLDKLFQMMPKEGKVSWQNLNVMPFMATNAMPEDREIVAIVERDREKKFLEYVPGEWEFKKRVGKYALYRRPPLR